MPLPAPHLTLFLLLLAFAGQVVALDSAPTGVIGVLPEKTSDADSIAPVLGMSAVIIKPGLAISLEEALPRELDGSPKIVDHITVVLPGGRHATATIIKRGSTTGAVLLRLEDAGLELPPLELADSTQVKLGDTVWTAGNPYGSLAIDGVAALARGIISGHYVIPADAPPVRGRSSEILSRYRGEVLETDAALNDGNQGGALLDDNGRLLGLASMGVARERRVGTVVPIHLIAADLALDLPLQTPAEQSDPVAKALAAAAAVAANSTVLIYMERPRGPGNPTAADGVISRPPTLTDATPAWDRERLQKSWDLYFYQQQTFFTDQAICAIVIDPAHGLLLTSASNLHGQAVAGHIIRAGQAGQLVRVVAIHEPLDLALLKADGPLAEAAVPLAAPGGLILGDPVATVGRFGDGGAYCLSSGVVSATDRRSGQETTHMYQTDALVNYSTLGGPVVDAAGQVVGMVIALRPGVQWGVNSGVGMFADAGALREALPQLALGKDIHQAKRIGMGVQFKLNKEQDDEQAQDMLIERLVPDSGASDAGLQPGDIITSVEGVKISNITDIARIIIRRKLGDSITVVAKRANESMTFTVVLKEF